MSEQKAMQPELLPCPFCGGPASREARNHTYETGCDNVGCSVLASAVQLSQVAADEAWNRRATPTALAASPEVAKLIAAERARVMRIAASLFPGGYDNNFAKIEAAALKGA